MPSAPRVSDRSAARTRRVLIAGQSNAVGLAPNPIASPPTMVPNSLYYMLTTLTDLIRASGTHGPEVGWCSVERAIVSKNATEGTSTADWIASTWPETHAASHALPLYPTWPVMVWYQGENNCLSGGNTNFKSETQTIFARYRAVFGASLFIYVVRIKADVTANPTYVHYDEIRALQAEVVAADALTELVSVDDLTLLVDGRHLDSASQITLGQRIAAACQARQGNTG